MGIYSDVLLTVDYDRTLTAPDSTIPQRNLDAIRYFMDNGGTFTVNTGRSVPMSQGRLLRDVPVNAPLLLYNGSADYDTATGTLTRYAPIELDAAQVLHQLQARFPDLVVEIQGLEHHHILQKDAGWEDYCDNNGCPWAYCTPHTVPQPLIKFAIYGEFRENTVASMFEASSQELARMDEAMEYVRSHWGDRVDIFRACHRIVDVHAKGCSKLAAARLLQQRLGKKHLVCVGDAENDVTMLDGADFAYCPADGIVADRYETVCKCADGAVADVIYKKIPEFLAIQP